jgi:hypothetical protein
MGTLAQWEPPSFVTRDELVATSKSVLGLPDGQAERSEHVVRLRVLGMDWDFGAVVFKPRVAAIGPDGKKIGALVLHGGSSDFKSLDPLIGILTRKFGYTVLAGTFPGRFYFDNDEHDWPGDTIEADGSVRTPIWQRGERIGPDEYEIITHTSNRDKWGRRTFARAKPGSNFYNRMAAWPAAFEESFVAASAQFLPSAEYTIYGTGHSTGGPFMCMLSQRIPNFAGLLAMENSTFGYTKVWQPGQANNKAVELSDVDTENSDLMRYRFCQWNELYIRTWRDLARYAGPEYFGDEGGEALLRLPALMEDVLASWDAVKSRPQFKAESLIPSGDVAALREAALVTADRLGLAVGERDALVARYAGYTRELAGPGVKPVPNVLFSIAKNSPDHPRAMYEDAVMPAFRAMQPAPRVALTEFAAGGHSYWKPLPDLPVGLAPAVAQLWNTAISNGYFVRTGGDANV